MLDRKNFVTVLRSEIVATKADCVSFDRVEIKERVGRKLFVCWIRKPYCAVIIIWSFVAGSTNLRAKSPNRRI